MTNAQPNLLILDACCLINLCATKYMAEILQPLPNPILVADFVEKHEVLYVYDGPLDNVRASKRQVDLSPFLQSGVLVSTTLISEAEQDLFIRLTNLLDDGEAMTTALAIERGWTIATDDQATISYLTANHLTVRYLTTPDIVKHWSNTSHPPEATLRDVVRDIRFRARYHPNSRHPLVEWWQNLLT
jgi:hypothetical protein